MKTTEFNNYFEVHSDIRLPFEPKGEAIALRKEIQRKLKALCPDKYNNLIACLITNEEGFFDVENVLLYNVGLGAFSHLSLDEISFSLIHNQNGYGKNYIYSYILSSELSAKSIHRPIIRFSFELDKLSYGLKPVDYWLAFHNGDIQISTILNPLEFGLSITLEVPVKQNIVALMKSLVDGIISTLHFQRSVDQIALNVISAKKNIKRDFLQRLFNKKDYSVLGERKVVSSYRSGIKWNPEDEKCTCVNLKQVTNTSQKFKIYGEVFLIR